MYEMYFLWQHIVGSCLQIWPDNFTLLMTMFTLFTFNVIIYMVRFVFYLSLLNMFFVSPFFPTIFWIIFLWVCFLLCWVIHCLSLDILLIVLSCQSLCSSDSTTLKLYKNFNFSPPGLYANVVMHFTYIYYKPCSTLYYCLNSKLSFKGFE